jgi:hypothetical protein
LLEGGFSIFEVGSLVLERKGLLFAHWIFAGGPFRRLVKDPRLLGTTTCELSIANTSSLLPAEGPSDPEFGRDTYITKDLASKVSQSGMGLHFLLLVKAIEHLRILHTSVDVV